jgi:cobalt transport protein ATP-binding subunit
MTAVRVHNLFYTYPHGHRALNGVSFEIAAGESVALIGPNGAGKSTLLLHLNGILRGQGEVEVFGLSASDGAMKEVRRRVGLVFQDPDDQLFMPTVLEDVALGPLNWGLPPAEATARARAALAQVGMGGAADRAPHHLSLGERKRVALATVLAMQPELLALDEPTANLDPRARRQLIGLLQELPQTKLIATHDLEMVIALCRRAILLDGGRVIAQGATSELLADAALLEEHGLEQPLSMRLSRPAGTDAGTFPSIRD